MTAGGLLYKADWAEARERYRKWWGPGRDGPIIQLYYPRPGPHKLRKAPEWLRPDADFGWAVMHWLTGPGRDPEADPGSLIDFFEDGFARWGHLRDAYPTAWLNLGPGVLAAYLTGFLKFETNTSWFELPRPMDWDDILKLSLSQDNPWWMKTKKLAKAFAARGRGRYLTGMTDLGGPLDVLASLRTGQQLLEDCVTDPDLIRQACRMILENWHSCFDELNRIIAAEGQDGSSAWMGIWAPGTWYPLQCDFSAMISPAMFEKLVLPDIEEQCARMDNSIYHWDGPGEIPHLDLLLSVKKLDGIQWVSGASAPDAAFKGWFKYYEKIQKAGKRLVMNNTVTGKNAVEIARKLAPQGLLINAWCGSEAEARSLEKELLSSGG